MKALTPEELAALNPGIRHTVETLRAWGFDTCDSGDGKTHDFNCDQPFPYVHIRCYPQDLVEDANLLASRLAEVGIDFALRPHPQDDPEGWAAYPSIEASYSPIDGGAFIHLANAVIPE